MISPNSSRRDFLKIATLGGIATSIVNLRGADPLSPTAAGSKAILGQTRARPAGQKPVHDLTTQPRERVRVGVIGLSRGMTHVINCLNIEFADVVAVCDLRADRANDAAQRCEKKAGRRP